MRSIALTISVVAVCTAASHCVAVTPPLPGMTSGTDDNGMQHIQVGLDDLTNSVTLHMEEPPALPVTMMPGFGIDYDTATMDPPPSDPSLFDVLEDVYFNAQYGWLPDGLIDLPPQGSFWIERISVSHLAGSTFKVFEAGMGNQMANWTMDEIYSSDGYRWQWDGYMQHDYFTADMVGEYSMSFAVYVGDSAGEPMDGYTQAITTLSFVAVPEPASLLLVLSSAILAAIGFRRK